MIPVEIFAASHMVDRFIFVGFLREVLHSGVRIS